MKSRRLRYCLDIRDRVSTEIAAFTESRFYDVIFRNARETFTLRYVKFRRWGENGFETLCICSKETKESG